MAVEIASQLSEGSRVEDIQDKVEEALNEAFLFSSCQELYIISLKTKRTAQGVEISCGRGTGRRA